VGFGEENPIEFPASPNDEATPPLGKAEVERVEVEGVLAEDERVDRTLEPTE